MKKLLYSFRKKKNYVWSPLHMYTISCCTEKTALTLYVWNQKHFRQKQTKMFKVQFGRTANEKPNNRLNEHKRKEWMDTENNTLTSEWANTRAHTSLSSRICPNNDQKIKLLPRLVGLQQYLSLFFVRCCFILQDDAQCENPLATLKKIMFISFHFLVRLSSNFVSYGF